MFPLHYIAEILHAYIYGVCLIIGVKWCKTFSPYDLQFNRNTSVTDDGQTDERTGRTTTMPIARPLLKYGRIKTNLCQIQHNVRAGKNLYNLGKNILMQ